MKLYTFTMHADYSSDSLTKEAIERALEDEALIQQWAPGYTYTMTKKDGKIDVEVDGDLLPEVIESEQPANYTALKVDRTYWDKFQALQKFLYKAGMSSKVITISKHSFDKLQRELLPEDHMNIATDFGPVVVKADDNGIDLDTDGFLNE